MLKYSCLLLLLLYFAPRSYAACSSNFGGCDKVRGRCWDTDSGNHFCTCNAGFRFYDQSCKGSCVDVDECQDNPCGENSQCINTWGSYECHCNCGYVMDYTGTKCLDMEQITGRCTRPNVCRIPHTTRERPFNKANAGQGYRTVEDYDIANPGHRRFWEYNLPLVPNPTGTCEVGYEHDACGLCVDINECAYNAQGRPLHDCDVNAKCTNTEGSFYCECRPGYIIGPCGKTCYRNRQSRPRSCDADLRGLLELAPGDQQTSSFITNFGTYVRALPVQNYGECNRRTPTNSIDRFDINHDGVNDVTLTWTCNAALGSSNLDSYSERTPKWGRWTDWTECKPTCWGGVQTRSRRCWYGIPGREGCPGSGTEKRNCFTGTRCPHRIRKNVKTLTWTEKNDYMQAFERYKADMSTTGFHNAGSSHGWPFQCEGRSCCPHGAKMKFITWHRSIVLNYEVGLSRYLNDKTLGLPYWNWLDPTNNNDMPDLGWDQHLQGRSNPWTNFTVMIDRTGPMRTIQRSNQWFRQGLQDSKDQYSDLERFNTSDNMQAFAENLEMVHNNPHIVACGNGQFEPEKCMIALNQLSFAAFDPLFMLHHTNVDRLSAIFEKKIQDDNAYTWTPQSTLEAFEPYSDFSRPHMPFGNKSLTPFKIVQKTANMRDFMYYEELMGAKYDCMDAKNLCGASRRSFGGDLLGDVRKPGLAQLLVGLYLQSIPQNVYVNFFEAFDPNGNCATYRQTMHLGKMLILGVPNQKPYQNTIPTTVQFEVGNFNIDSDIPIVACYTLNATCTVGCRDPVPTSITSRLPSPILIQLLSNTVVNVGKFHWQTGNRMPQWPIAVTAGSDWIKFFGNRASNIVQVPNRAAFNGCNAAVGRPFECSGKPCILPIGRYYLIDDTESHCRAGLRMIVNSRK